MCALLGSCRSQLSAWLRGAGAGTSREHLQQGTASDRASSSCNRSYYIERQ